MDQFGIFQQSLPRLVKFNPLTGVNLVEFYSVLILSRRKEPMTLHQLSIWIVVAKHQSVTKTADELHIRQPSVTQQIQSFENEFGIKLYKVNMVNKGKGIELTQAGKTLLKYAKLILLQVKTLESKLKSNRRRRRR